MKKIILLLLLLPLLGLAQQNNTTNTNFTNGLASSKFFNIPRGTTPPTTGILAGSLFFHTVDGLQYYDGSVWKTVAAAGTGVTSFNGRTGAVTPQSGDYSSFYVPLARTITINGTTYDLSTDRSWTVGTVTSITPGYGLTPQTPITSNGGFGVDTLVLDTIYARIGDVGTQYWQRSGSTLSPATSGDDITTTGDINASSISLSNNITATGLNSTGQATLGSLNQGGKMNFVSGGTGAVGGTLGFSTNATTNILSLQNIQGLELTSTNSNGYVAVRATGANGSINFRTGSNINGYVHPSGNWSFQNGGTYTDNGYRIDVNGTGRFTSTLTANSFVKSGGTSAQFLMGNGTVQDTTQIQTVANFFPKGDTRYVTKTTNQNIEGVKTFRRSQLLNGLSKLYLSSGDTTISGFIFGGASSSGSLFLGSRQTTRLSITGNVSANNISPVIDREYDLGRKDRGFDSLFVNNADIEGNTQIAGNTTIGTGTNDSKLNVFTNGTYGLRLGYLGATDNFMDGATNYFRSENGDQRFIISASGVRIPTLTGSVTDMVTISTDGTLGRTAIPSGGGGGTVVSVGVASANGFAGTSSGGDNPALTLSTTVTGLLKGNGTAISAATAGTDYLAPTGSGAGLSNVVNSITGTSNQVIASASTGAVTLSLPQSISTGSSVRFGELGLGTSPLYTLDATKSISGNYIGHFHNTNTTSGASFGLFLKAGTNTSDLALNINNAANTVNLFNVNGAGNTMVGGDLSFGSSSYRAGSTIRRDGTNLIISAGTTGFYVNRHDNSATDLFINSSGNIELKGVTATTGSFSGALSASNLSGTNTGDQTTITGNAGTATALQTARNIQGVSFNGTADINPINGTGFVKATGTTLSYDNTTYAPLNSPTFTGTPTLPTGTIGVTQTQGDNSTKIATTAYVDRLGGGIITSGRYDGLITGGTNVTGTSYTVNGAHYRRIGNEVTVTGRCSLTTTSSGASVFYIDLPIASNLSAGADLLGAANADTNSTNIVINADTGGDRALVEFTAAGSAFMTVYYNFTYTVL